MVEGGTGTQENASYQLYKVYRDMSPEEAYKYTLNPYQHNRNFSHAINDLMPCKRPTDDSSIIEFRPVQDISDTMQNNVIVNDFRSVPL